MLSRRFRYGCKNQIVQLRPIHLHTSFWFEHFGSPSLVPKKFGFLATQSGEFVGDQSGASITASCLRTRVNNVRLQERSIIPYPTGTVANSYIITHTWMDGWMGGWVDGRMDGWVGGWMDGWMDKSTHAPTHTLDIHIKLYISRTGDSLKGSQK